MFFVRSFVRCLLGVACGVILPVVSAVEQGGFTWDDADTYFNWYCYECHGGYATDGDLDLINIDHQSDLEAAPEKWSYIVQSLRTHYMPHADGREMPLPHRRALIDKIQRELGQLAVNYQPQSASLRRLNRSEFNNTLNDLFLVDMDLSESLPADNGGYGFDTIAAALSVSPLLFERYLDAASIAGELAIPLILAPSEWSLAASDFKGGNTNGQRKWLVASSAQHAVRGDVYFPAKGSYELSLHFSADQAGDTHAMAQVRFAGQVVDDFEVTAARDAEPSVMHCRVMVSEPGAHALEVRFLNDYYKETAAGKEDRNLIFHQVDFNGPFQTEEDLESAFLRRHFGPTLDALSSSELKAGMHRFVSRAYRRPVTDEELASLWELYLDSDDQRGEQSQREALRAVVDAVVAAPSFLFRFEPSADDSECDSFALASWLSYFLWSSMPDDRLFELARRGELEAQLEGEIARMLADPKSVALADNFAGQWWRFRDLDIHQPDAAVYPAVSPELLADMQEETRRFFVELMRADGSLLDILAADYSFLNERLARHYGIADVRGAEFRRVSLKDSLRRGVWSHASVLTVTSYANHTSPVLRGQWILENLIGLSPPPPPDNVPSLSGTEGKPQPQDLRASLALHRENSDCASCHNTMDPLGLALESYDGIGQLRTIAERKQLKAETLFDDTVIQSPVDLAQYFEHERQDDFVINLARKFAIYAAGRGLNWRDEAALRRVAQRTSDADFRFSAMIDGIVDEFAPIATVKALARSTASEPSQLPAHDH